MCCIPSRQNVIDHSTAERASSRGTTCRKRRISPKKASGSSGSGSMASAPARRAASSEPAGPTIAMGVRANAGSALRTRQRSKPVMGAIPALTTIICGFSRRAMSSASVPPDAVSVSQPVRFRTSSAAPRKRPLSSTRRMEGIAKNYSGV